MAPNPTSDLELSYVQIVQALRHSEIALGLVKNLYPTDPVREAYFQEAVNILKTTVYDILNLPFEIKFPLDPVISPVEDNQLIINFANCRAEVAIKRTYEAIKQIHETYLLVSDSDTLGPLMLIIQANLEDALQYLHLAQITERNVTDPAVK